MRGRNQFTEEFFGSAGTYAREITTLEEAVPLQTGRPPVYPTTIDPTTRPPVLDERPVNLLDPVTNNTSEDTNINIYIPENVVTDPPMDTGGGYGGGGYGGGNFSEEEDVPEDMDGRGGATNPEEDKKARQKKILIWIIIAIAVVLAYKYYTKKKK